MDSINDSSIMNNENNTTTTSIETDIYYKTLCSSGLSFIAKQPQQIEQRKQILLDNKQKIVYSNYDSFLKYSNFTKQIINDFQTIETCLDQLNTGIPEFKDQCIKFSNNTKQISNRWNNVSIMLSKYPQLIEFMEIPQLLNNCIRTFYYDDAISICNFVSKLCSKHSKDATIFQNMLYEVDKCKDIMVTQIIRELSGNILLPTCMKMIKYLRQIDRFNENQLRINFLTCRDVWFQSELNREIGNQNYSLNQINRVTESFRVNIFDIVTQYQAIFPELDELNDNNNPIQSKIINSWLLVKIEQYLNILRTNLQSCVSINSILYIDTIIENCFYLGLSMNKIGADIRPELILIFNDFLQKRFEYCVQKSTRQFCDSLSDIFVGNISNEDIQNDFAKSLENYPILKKYQSNLLALFHEIRNNIPLALISTFVQILNQSFTTIMIELKSYIKKHEFGLNKIEFQNYLNFCHLFRHLLPQLNQSFQKLCPISIVGQKIGLTTIEMNRNNLFESYELDFKTPILEINNLIKN
ncbi:conserved oligomeric Golgi complex subunit 8-like isoform X1 [Dermatophagoides pteronyssinus]|uniref:conserved oligomeric Golgi complex subunit 8-like isoform X1 n=1 Tax=Dermatophagoides pteronyssinus TaxID=6956 RepID=UPI003F664083